MQLSLNSESQLPLVDQIVNGIRNLIDDRVLRPAMRLPPIRSFAETHEVSRFTAVEAYDRLVALGYLQSRRGSGFYVTARNDPGVPAKPTAEAERAFDNVGVLYQTLDDSQNHAKIGAGWLPSDWYDEEGVRRNLRTLARRESTQVASYGTPRGYRPLRDQLQIKLDDMGITASSDQIVLSHGATHALDIITRALLKPGDCVFVDDPGYWNLFSALRLFGVNLVGVPRNQNGPDVEALEGLLAEHQPKLFFTHSVLHNPTACCLSPATAFRVLQLADKHDFLIVEDDTYADLYPGTPTLMAQLDQLHRVIYVSSFAKTLSASLRVGFLVAEPALAARLTDVKIITCVTTSEFSENLVYLMLTEGRHRKYIERVRSRLAEASYATIKLLERSGLEVYAEPKGGMFVWAQVPGIADSVQLETQAANIGVMLAPGNVFRPQAQASPWMRFNVAHALDPRLERFLGQALARI